MSERSNACRVRWVGWLGLIWLVACGEDGMQPEAVAAKDAGEDAALAAAGSTADPHACAARGCYCERICAQAAALHCALDDGLESCIDACAEAPTGCAEASLGLLACQYARPADAYSCDPVIDSAVVAGCDDEQAVLGACSSQ